LLGHHSGLRGNQASEERVTIVDGPLAGGTTMHDDAPSDADRLPELAAGHGVVGHAQAAGRARLNGEPRINRRDFASLDDGLPGTHFVSLQRSLEDFNATRAVMNAADARRHHPAIGARDNNGINAFLDVRSRTTLAVPQREHRAYPYLPF